MELKFRDLTKDDIECRVQSSGTITGSNEMWARVLLYKDARVDMAILDETVQPQNWQRDHKELKGNIYCGIGINVNAGLMRNNEPLAPLWVWKWDCGAESNTEKEKGEASDSFKRAGFNWGIGRELYTKIPAMIYGLPSKKVNGKDQVDGYFEVEKIKIENKEITALSLIFVGKKETKRCFVWTKENGVSLQTLK